MRLLGVLEADLSYLDPFVPPLAALDLDSVDLDTGVEKADLVAIVTAHPDIDYEAVVSRAKLVIDFRGVTRDISATNLARL